MTQTATRKSTTKKQETRTLYVKTRRAWKDGSRVEIDFTSEVSVNGKIDHIANHTVNLYNDGRSDTCSCMGYASSERKYPSQGSCCHIEHFRAAEDFRRRIAVADQPVESIQSVVAVINLLAGKSIIKIGASSVPVPEKDLGQMTIDESRRLAWERSIAEHPPVIVKERKNDALSAPLNGNRGFSLMKRSA